MYKKEPILCGKIIKRHENFVNKPFFHPAYHRISTKAVIDRQKKMIQTQTFFDVVARKLFTYKK